MDYLMFDIQSKNFRMFCKSHWLRSRADNTGRKSHKGFNGVFSMKGRDHDFFIAIFISRKIG